MITLYEKDEDGRVALNVDAQITAKATNDPALPGERNASGIVYCKNGDEIAVVVTIDGVPHSTIASFRGIAATGKMSCVHVRVRAYADVGEPPSPPEEPS